MRRVNIVPNIITAFGLACGLFVIFKVNMTEPGMGNYQVLQISAILLLLAAFADWFDGTIARIMHAESEFGFTFDSLSDAVTFGVAPSVLFLKSLSLEQGTLLSFFAVIGAMLFSICGVLRLVRYNVKSHEAKSHPHMAQLFQKHFTGFPIPAAALTAVSSNLLLSYPLFETTFELTETTRAIALIVIMIVLGYFMVSRVKFPSAKVLHFRLHSFQLVFFSVLVAIFLLYGVIYFFPITLAIITWSYFLIGLIIALIRLIAGKKSKTLEEFEPDQDEDAH